MKTLNMNAHAVLLPAIGDLVLTDTLKKFFDNGGLSLLLGETREEYVGRKMSAERVRSESRNDFQRITRDVTERVGRSLIAIDQEPAGILRLHELVPAMPNEAALHRMTADEIRELCKTIAESSAQMGVNMFLAPIVDVVSGQNPWLKGRTLGPDPREVARIAAAYVRGVQEGGVIATAKHFPGHHNIEADPAVDIAEVRGTRADLEPGFIPFHAVIEAGVGAIMTGPALVPAMDPEQPSSMSHTTVKFLRESFGFRGLVVSDDIDAKATLRDGTVTETAVAALNAGADLLLLAGNEHLPEISEAILAAVADGRLSEARLAEAAAKVRSFTR